jgi:hypothetical protein
METEEVPLIVNATDVGEIQTHNCQKPRPQQYEDDSDYYAFES